MGIAHDDDRHRAPADSADGLGALRRRRDRALGARGRHRVALGIDAFFSKSQADGFFFKLTAQDPLGRARAFAAARQLPEAPYRYGRIGLPALGWLLALGRPAWVVWSMLGIYVASIAAIPGIAAVLLDDLGAPPGAGLVVLLAPGIMLNNGHVYADPLLIALLLLACVFEGRGRRPAALITLAAAILVKEVALFALIPWIWSAVARRDRRGVVQAGAAVVPYALWCIWVRWRLGAFPFLAHTYSRTGALSLPLVGLRQALDARTPNIGVVTGAVIITVVIGAAASWVMRGTWVGALAFVYTILTLCLGKNALAYLLENARVMAVAQVFALVCLTAAAARWWRGRRRVGTPAAEHGLLQENAYL